MKRGDVWWVNFEGFVLAAEEQPRSSVSVFAGKERWQIWRRLEI